jgi:hypothetical protein
MASRKRIPLLYGQIAVSFKAPDNISNNSIGSLGRFGRFSSKECAAEKAPRTDCMKIYRREIDQTAPWALMKAGVEGSRSTRKPRLRWARGDKASMVLFLLPTWRPTRAWSTA